MTETYTKKEIFNGTEIETIYRMAQKPVDPDHDVSANGPGMESMAMGVCPPFNQRTYLAAPGIICEQDVPVKLRDGVTIYVDIFRPENEIYIPAIVSWSFYGKRPGEAMSQWMIPGVVPGTVSTLAKFESPDPAYWCHKGYAIANVDPRGVGHSEGDVSIFGSQDARDGYDFIEWLAAQWWCSGKIGMAGNSALAMVQWRIAAECPPHLTCIAPWEGTGDLYRESIFEGGIPALSFNEYIVSNVTGLHGVDDIVAMGKKYPMMNPYWEDKIPHYENITIPVYATAGWNHFHLRGAFEGFRNVKSHQKWLRVHREFEWPDACSKEGLVELTQYFDRFLKDIHNAWDMTPSIRLEVQDALDFVYQSNRPEMEFPLARTVYQKLFLDARSSTLSETIRPIETVFSYDGNTGVANFDYHFTEDTEITGFMKLHLWVEAQSHDDMDLFVNIQKLSTKGEWIPTTIFGMAHPGTWGKLRVSHRALDLEKSTDFRPVHSHLKEEKLKPGEIVPVDIDIVPTSRIWHKGQTLRVQIAGRYIRDPWFEPLSWETNNQGNHIIHTGGSYDSYLQIPTIPPRFVDGDCIYR